MYYFEEIFDVIKFPSGEEHVRVKENKFVKSNETILVKTLDWNSVMNVISANSILFRNSVEVKWIFLYKPFARQDRVTYPTHGCETYIFDKLLFDFGIDASFVDVHSGTEYNGKYHNTISTRYPHKTHDNYVSNYTNIINFCYKNYFSGFADNPVNEILKKYVRVFPDKGSLLREKYNEAYAIVFNKVRDTDSGKIIGVDCKYDSSIFVEDRGMNLSGGVTDLWICDDICDGGRTFLEIAKVLKEKVSDKFTKRSKPMYLYVTHGLFTNEDNLKKLSELYTKIFTTNTVCDTELMKKYNVNVLDIKKLLEMEKL